MRFGKGGTAVALEDVSLQYGAFSAIRGISFSVPRGQFLAVVGPTGCGKSSVLNMVAGLLAPTSGTVRTGGKPVVSAGTPVVFAAGSDASGALSSQAYHRHCQRGPVPRFHRGQELVYSRHQRRQSNAMIRG